MTFASLLRHVVRVDRRVGAGDYDELGMPTTVVEAQGEWRCRIEPKTAREVALLSQAGAVVADHIIYGYPVDGPAEGDRLVELDGAGGSPTGRVFEVQAIDDAGGAGHHYEVQAHRVASAELEPS